MQIQADGNNIIVMMLDENTNWLSEKNQRELLLWFRDNKADMLLDIVCENCPEHIETNNYCDNKVENGE